MNKHRGLGSILERASEIYDFKDGFLRGPGQSKGEELAPESAPEAAPAPLEPKVELPVDASLAEPDLAVDPAPWPMAEAEAAPEPRQRRSRSTPGPVARIDRTLLSESGFIEPDGAVSILAEEFRIVKRRLLAAMTAARGGKDSKRRTVLVCSAQPDEGKTFCAINLALSMAGEKDLEVLLVDGDFAKPEIPALLGVRPGPGFSDAIADKNCDVNSLVIPTDITGLSLLPAGRRANDITELLASARTSEVLRDLADGHDNRIIIFDSPPALAASPASVLASHAGQIMLVVRADRTTEGDVREALSLLSACGSISLMLNRTSLAMSGRRFGSYYEQGPAS